MNAHATLQLDLNSYCGRANDNVSGRTNVEINRDLLLSLSIPCPNCMESEISFEHIKCKFTRPSLEVDLEA